MLKIDAHMHFSPEHVTEALVTMDQNEIEYVVNLGFPQSADDFMDMLKLSLAEAEGRIATLSTFNFEGLEEPGSIDRLVERFRREVSAGARGLKVFKSLGLYWKYSDGTHIRVDDERLDPIWAAAGDMHVPVLIHTADPIPNWMPLDESNPRREMFKENPSVYFGDGEHFDRLELLAQRERVLKRHPNTIFVNAHWGCYPEHLDHLLELLETYPNFYADTELGKVRMVPEGETHKSHRDIMVKYADRHCFGTDLCYRKEREVDHPWNKDMYDRQVEYFETDETGGLNLPPDVLDQFYYANAKRLYHL